MFSLRRSAGARALYASRSRWFSPCSTGGLRNLSPSSSCLPLASSSGILSRRPYASTALPASLPKLSESFLDGTSASYVEDMYLAWKKDPSKVHPSWDSYFRSVESGKQPGEAYMSPPTLHGATRTGSAPSQSSPAGAAAPSEDELQRRVRDSMRLLLLVRSYQVRGHTLAKLNPLTGGPLFNSVPPELLPSTYGWTEADMDRPIFLGGDNLISGFLSSGKPYRTLREIVNRLQETYCSSIGVEYMHIPDRKECNWIRERLETPEQYSFTPQQKIHILDRLTWSTLFERFLALKYPGTKRFGLDGCEVLIPGMKALIDDAADYGVESIVIGMPHRGRLNVLANVVRKPLEALLHEFDYDADQAEDIGAGSGDVKYHLGTSYDRPTVNGKKVHLSLVANPSHLEAVNPVVEGKTKAKQHYLGDKDKSKVMAILLHGDSAFCGQGVVYETFDLGQWKNFATGGTVHIIVNNQVGFTTSLRDSRLPNASPYPTDVAKTAGAPILHVNGDDPEAVVRCLKFAAEYRQAFKKDVVVDIICYRKPGHNEIDEPRYTQPLMYKLIDKQVSALDKYRQKLLEEKVIQQEICQKMEDKVMDELNRAHKLSASYVPSKMEWFSSYWKGYKSSAQLSKIHPTGVPRTVLSKVASALTHMPPHFKLHRNLDKIMKAKKHALETGQGIDWATAEALAFGTLLLEGNVVRLTGQDVERGTFSHRHAVLHDSETDETYVPLQHLDPSQATFMVHNSSLSEFAVLGYELGFSLENPNSLVLWEAQFGDFANGAQVIIDQFISSGEQKWQRQSGLVLLLPHGYDGLGPEHSSARLERFLQLCDSDPNVIPDANTMNSTQYNLQVVNCTTSANYFHVLRRQVHRDFRKPLIVMSPKRLLKYPPANSPLDEFDDIGTWVRFRPVIPEVATDLVPPEKVRRLIFCTGNVYYDLANARDARGIKDVAIVRIEQLAPFPFDHVAQQGALYKNAEIMWAQEEPMNMGAWYFAYHHIRSALKAERGNFEPLYAGRPSSASPATGSAKTHKRQLANLVDAAMTL